MSSNFKTKNQMSRPMGAPVGTYEYNQRIDRQDSLNRMLQENEASSLKNRDVSNAEIERIRQSTEAQKAKALTMPMAIPDWAKQGPLYGSVGGLNPTGSMAQSQGPKTFGMDPMMQLASVGQQFQRMRQIQNPNILTREDTQSFPNQNNFQPTDFQPQMDALRGGILGNMQSVFGKNKSQSSNFPTQQLGQSFPNQNNFQPTNFQPQMDALRGGIMGRMSQQLGIALPKIGQPYKPPKPTPYWQQAGMNPPKFPTY
jgi:hypothetical protein